MNQFDLVEIKDALAEEHLPAGAIGAIVHVFSAPQLAYEVEFSDLDGRPLRLVTLTADQIRPAADR